MTLLFDGSFHPGDHKIGGENGSFGGWLNYSCTPQPDSVTAVPAPGGRSGTAAKFVCRPGSSYDCGGAQHNQIASYTPEIPSKYSDVWYGFSMYLDPTWQAGSIFGIGLGESYQSAEGAVANAGLKLGSGGTNNAIEMYLNGKGYALPGNFTPGKWDDWMYHVLWRTGATGKIDIYRNGQIVFSRTNIATKNTSYGDFGHRVGLYRPKPNTKTQILYILDPKIGTTRADVEYGGTTQPPTPPPTTIEFGGFEKALLIAGSAYVIKMALEEVKK